MKKTAILIEDHYQNDLPAFCREIVNFLKKVSRRTVEEMPEEVAVQ